MSAALEVMEIFFCCFICVTLLCALYVVIKQQFFTLISSNARMEYGPDSINQPRLNSIPTYTHNTTGIQLVQQTQHYITLHHPPCVGFDNAAVGLLQLGVRGPAAVDSRAVTESAQRRCSACV